jgi:hypothetical protein
MKDRKGYIIERAGKLYVRIQFTDNLGKRRELRRRAKDRSHARQLQKELVKQLESAERGNQRAELDAQKLTFAKVAAAYEVVRLIPAEYVGDRKIRGLRSLRTPKAYLKRLVEHFGAARIRSITRGQVDQYRLSLLAETLTIASANRILALLRSVFTFAKREGWISKSPFEAHFLFEFLLPLLFLGGELSESFLNVTLGLLCANAEACQGNDCRDCDCAELPCHGCVLSNGYG